MSNGVYLTVSEVLLHFNMTEYNVGDNIALLKNNVQIIVQLFVGGYKFLAVLLIGWFYCF